jgi:hypothetical protein
LKEKERDKGKYILKKKGFFFLKGVLALESGKRIREEAKAQKEEGRALPVCVERDGETTQTPYTDAKEAKQG